MARLQDLKRFYRLLDQLKEKVGGERKLADCHGRMDWPDRGIYFFFEPGEIRSDSGAGLRVVRIGTHALTAKSRTTLWNRLSQHRGTQKTGSGNHRGSIFRLIVGASLKCRDQQEEPISWGVGMASPVIIGPLAMLGFLDIGGTDERQAIYRRTDHSDIT